MYYGIRFTNCTPDYVRLLLLSSAIKTFHAPSTFHCAQGVGQCTYRWPQVTPSTIFMWTLYSTEVCQARCPECWDACTICHRAIGWRDCSRTKQLKGALAACNGVVMHTTLGVRLEQGAAESGYICDDILRGACTLIDETKWILVPHMNITVGGAHSEHFIILMLHSL